MRHEPIRDQQGNVVAHVAEEESGQLRMVFGVEDRPKRWGPARMLDRDLQRTLDSLTE